MSWKATTGLTRLTIEIPEMDCDQSAKTAKDEYALSNTNRTTFAFDAFFVWNLVLLADKRSGFFIENLSRGLARDRTRIKRCKFVLGLQHSKYEFAMLNTYSTASIVAMNIL
jgi:hypothetical protein